MPSPDDPDTTERMNETLVKPDLDIEKAKAFVREHIEGVDGAIQALEDARKVSEQDLRVEFRT